MVGLGRLELPTSALSGLRSNQLSYKPARLYSSERTCVGVFEGRLSYEPAGVFNVQEVRCDQPQVNQHVVGPGWSIEETLHAFNVEGFPIRKSPDQSLLSS